MKLRGPIFFLPLAFFLCTFMVTIFRFLSAPEFSESDIVAFKAIVLNCEENVVEATGISDKDTLNFRGEYPRAKSGAEIELYTIKRFGIIKSSKEEILKLKDIKQKAMWFSLFSGLGLIASFAFLYYSTKRIQQHG